MTFFVDSTPPEISNVSGLEEKIVNAAGQTVDFEVFDAMGVKRVTVYVNEREIPVDDTDSEVTVFRGTLTLPEGADQSVRLVAEDQAGNVTDTASTDFHPGFAFCDRITISTNFFVRLYANRRAFMGCVCVLAGTISLCMFFFMSKRRKEK